MKKFLIRTFTVLSGALFLFMIFNLIYYQRTKNTRIVAFEVYDALDTAEKNEGYTKLVLGDSVARQIFSPDFQSESDDTCYLATNQAVMTAGDYILMRRFMENNPQLNEVYYIARPDSMMGSINLVYTYSYFVIPMYEELYTQYLDAETKDCFEDTFGKFFIEKEFPQWLLAKYPKLLDIYQDCIMKVQQICHSGDEAYEQNMAVLYLQKMKEACDERNIEFHVLASPLPESYLYDVEELRNKLTLVGGEDMFLEFQDSIVYVDDAEFVDGIHMNDAFLEKMRVVIQDDLLDGEAGNP